MASLPKTFLTPEDYLKFERSAEERHEYWDGEIFLMSGATRAHGLIVANVIGELRQQLKDRPCEVYPSSMRVRIPNTNRYVYPDVTVVCGEPKFEDEEFDTLLNPTLIVEVLSPSTENYDRGAKLDNYLKIDALEGYLIIAQKEMRALLYARQADNRWLLSEATRATDAVPLEAIGGQLTLAEIYSKVPLDK